MSADRIEDARGLAEYVMTVRPLHDDHLEMLNLDAVQDIARAFLALEKFWVSEGGPPLHDLEEHRA